MSFAKILAGFIFILCLAVAYFSWNKNSQKAKEPHIIEVTSKVETIEEPAELVTIAVESSKLKPVVEDVQAPEIDRINYLFKPFHPQLPIVETVTYSSKVDWLKGRPAYLGDYASFFQTSKHFISRSLKGKANYFAQNVSNGDRFNVLRKDKNIEFHLLLDISRLKMWFYYFDQDKNERVLLKTYRVSAGKLDDKKHSGSLTPLGQYSLGKEIAIYKESVMGTFNNQPCEMISVFGSRWIPFEKEIGPCTSAAKGLGIHGMPWRREPNGQIVECREDIGKFESSGCVRLLTEDVEEIFSIIITKPSFIHIVCDFNEAVLPGIEVSPEL